MNVAFLAVSNLMIINCVTVKLQFFPQDEADLFIMERIGVLDYSLLTIIKKQKVFRNIFVVSDPVLDFKKSILGKLPKVRALFLGKTYEKYFDYYFSKIVSDKQYDHLLTCYLSNMILYQAIWFIKHNPKITIQFIEEATFDYTRPESALTSILPVGPRAKEPLYFVREWLIQTPYLRRLKKHVDGTIYLRLPEAFAESKMYQIQKVLPSNTNDGGRKLWKSLAQKVPEELCTKYEQNDFIYVGGYLWDAAMKEASVEKTIISQMTKESQQKVILKTHVNSLYSKNYYDKSFGKNNKIYIDPGTCLFGAVLYSLKDLDNKVLITYSSSVLMQPKLWFDKEPYLIFTYRLYPNWAFEKDKIFDNFVEHLRDQYSDPEKVMVPNSLLEFSEMLQECAFKLTAAKYLLDGWSYEDYLKLLEDKDEWTDEESETMADIEDADSLTAASEQFIEPETEVSEEKQYE